ncbi:hypothetical protein Vretimale_10681 [Volvox reticuliferus]|nr:hypothetical protein Vretimale_10681 [Volvox reticuliferus]
MPTPNQCCAPERSKRGSRWPAPRRQYLGGPSLDSPACAGGSESAAAAAAEAPAAVASTAFASAATPLHRSSGRSDKRGVEKTDDTGNSWSYGRACNPTARTMPPSLPSSTSSALPDILQRPAAACHEDPHLQQWEGLPNGEETVPMAAAAGAAAAAARTTGTVPVPTPAPAPAPVPVAAPAAAPATAAVAAAAPSPCSTGPHRRASAYPDMEALALRLMEVLDLPGGAAPDGPFVQPARMTVGAGAGMVAAAAATSPPFPSPADSPAAKTGPLAAGSVCDTSMLQPHLQPQPLRLWGLVRRWRASAPVRCQACPSATSQRRSGPSIAATAPAMAAPARPAAAPALDSAADSSIPIEGVQASTVGGVAPNQNILTPPANLRRSSSNSSSNSINNSINNSSGSSGPVRLLAATTDPLVASYRPLSFYLITEAVAVVTHLALVGLMGFRVAGVTRGGTATVYEWRPRRQRPPAVAAAVGAAVVVVASASASGRPSAAEGTAVAKRSAVAVTTALTEVAVAAPAAAATVPPPAPAAALAASAVQALSAEADDPRPLADGNRNHRRGRTLENLTAHRSVVLRTRPELPKMVSEPGAVRQDDGEVLRTAKIISVETLKTVETVETMKPLKTAKVDMDELTEAEVVASSPLATDGEDAASEPAERCVDKAAHEGRTDDGRGGRNKAADPWVTETQGRDGGEHNFDTDDTPLVFLHGIGLGLTPYLRLLSRLVTVSGGRRPVYAVQYKHVSMRLTATIPAPHEVANDVAAFLVSRGVGRMSLLAHSYGTLVASALTKLAAASSSAPGVSRLTLVDPVCFAMFLPHLVRNAIYQQPVSDHLGEHEQHQRHPQCSRQQQRQHHQQGMHHHPQQQPGQQNEQPGHHPHHQSPSQHIGQQGGFHELRRVTEIQQKQPGGGFPHRGPRIVQDNAAARIHRPPTASEIDFASPTRPKPTEGFGDGAATPSLGPMGRNSPIGGVVLMEDDCGVVGRAATAAATTAATAAGNGDLCAVGIRCGIEQDEETEDETGKVEAAVEAASAMTSAFATDGSSVNAGRQGPSSVLRRRRLMGRSLLRGLVVAEFHCSVALRRRLDWRRVNMWPSELPPCSTVVLGGRDNLVPVREIRRMLANRAALVGPAHPHPRVLFRDDLGHGGFLADEDCQAYVIAAALGVGLQWVREVFRTNASRRQTRQEHEQETQKAQVTRLNVTQLRADRRPVAHIPLAPPHGLAHGQWMPRVFFQGPWVRRGGGTASGAGLNSGSSGTGKLKY